MPAGHANVWRLSYSELAQLCQEIARNPSLGPGVREEAQRIHDGWNDAFAMNVHEQGARERQTNVMLALRKRTIELVVKTAQVTE